jgi:ribosomal-protein-alanine N-acetyltransferase
MIRRFAANDLASLLRLEEAAFEHPWTEEQLFATLEATSSLALVDYRDGGLVGYLLFLCGPGEAELLRVATAPLHRRSRIARELLLAGIEELRTQHAERVHLEVREGNTGARAFYGTFGFVEAGRRVRYYRGIEDAILYVLELDP